jgi:light-regulated signal transduction histidine kinase (bacteriophytochrome)
LGYVTKTGGATLSQPAGESEGALRKPTEGELQKLNADLERLVAARTAEQAAANRELESFTYSVSHDLRAPIRTILGYAAILKEDYADRLDAAAVDMIDRQVAAAKRMETLVLDLLEYSRVGRRELVVSEFDLSRLGGEVAAEIIHRNRTLKVRFEIEPGLRAYGDPALVRFVLQNLFENAVKFSAPTGAAAVEFGHEPGGAFFVRDHGVGFDMKYADKLFVPFERLHNANDFPGTGIGLANVQKIIQRHGGHVSGEGAPNEGATFRFTLGGPH